MFIWDYISEKRVEFEFRCSVNGKHNEMSIKKCSYPHIGCGDFT